MYHVTRIPNARPLKYEEKRPNKELFYKMGVTEKRPPLRINAPISTVPLAMEVDMKVEVKEEKRLDSTPVNLNVNTNNNSCCNIKCTIL